MSAEAPSTSVTAIGSIPFDVERVRKDFPILQRTLPSGRRLVYLDNGATAQKPSCVIEKMRDCLEQYNANVHRGIYELGERTTAELTLAREKIRRFLNAREPDDFSLSIGDEETQEVVFTSGTTMSINMVALGWGRQFLRPGDEILVNEMEHHSNLVPWQMAAKSTGAILRFVPLTSDGRLDLDQLDTCLTRKTKLLAVTGMSNVLGTVNPIGFLAERAHAVGAKILVDGAQSIPHSRFDVQATDIDFLAFSGHKLYGPTGIGVLYAKREILAEMEPVFGGGNMINRVYKDHSTWAKSPNKFEAGTLPYVEAIGLGAAIDYLSEIGWTAIETQERRLAEYAQPRLSDIPGLRLFGPDLANRGAIFSFSLPDVHAHDLSQRLDGSGVAVRGSHHCTMPLHDFLEVDATTRASFAFYNTLEEVDALVEAIAAARRKFERGRKSPSSPHQPPTTNH